MRELLLWASRNRSLGERLLRRRFMRRAVSRFMPGEELDDAVAAARRLAEAGISSVLTRLGENVHTPDEADEVTHHYVSALDRVKAEALDAELSIKLTQLGLDLSPDRAAANLQRILCHADELENFVWIDMESSSYVDATLEIFRYLRLEHTNLGICLQAYLYRTRRDLTELLPLQPAIRLVKGAYDEPPHLAFDKKRKVDASYLKRATTLLQAAADRPDGRPRIAFATHDTALIERIRARAESLGVPKSEYEIQMLYGIQRAAQRKLVDAGLPVRVLISYGSEWFPWFMRRLAERPANLLFLLKNVFSR